jgi:hypothetical protein
LRTRSREGDSKVNIRSRARRTLIKQEGQKLTIRLWTLESATENIRLSIGLTAAVLEDVFIVVDLTVAPRRREVRGIVTLRPTGTERAARVHSRQVYLTDA